MFKKGDRVRRKGVSAYRVTQGQEYIVAFSGSAGGLHLEAPADDGVYEATLFELLESAEVRPGAMIVVPPAAPTQGINPKDLVGQKKVDLSLIPPAALIYIALAMEDGAKKYGPFNWRENKVRARVYLAAAMRHIAAKLDGEELAADSLKPHLAHAMACLAIYVDAEETGNLHDDRPTPGAAAKLIAKWEKKPEEKKETA